MLSQSSLWLIHSVDRGDEKLPRTAGVRPTVRVLAFKQKAAIPDTLSKLHPDSEPFGGLTYNLNEPKDSYLDKNQIRAGEIVEELVVINLEVRARNYLF